MESREQPWPLLFVIKWLSNVNNVRIYNSYMISVEEYTNQSTLPRWNRASRTTLRLTVEQMYASKTR